MLQDDTAITVSTAMTVHDVVGRVRLVQEAMKSVMKENEHYGKIPGCGNKPTLLQPGAQLLAMLFRLTPDYRIDSKDLGGGHREHTVTCYMASLDTGQSVGCGIGSCSTMESKYRYRTGEVTPTGRPVPKEYWTDRDISLIGGKGHTAKKIDGRWEIVMQGERTDNPDIADTYNTVLKMAKKRAFVDAVLNTTAASDMFTQDLEDIAENKAEPPRQERKDWLAGFKAMANEYNLSNGISHEQIKHEVEQRLGMSLSKVSNERQAKDAEDILTDIIGDAEEASQADITDEDIPF
jgi:hypothetical protein